MNSFYAIAVVENRGMGNHINLSLGCILMVFLFSMNSFYFIAILGNHLNVSITGVHGPHISVMF
jgi:hypothetical protein